MGSNGEERPAELPLASAEEEAEVERVRAKFEEFDTEAVEAELARLAAERVAEALPAPRCKCDDPLVSDGSCARCGKRAR